MRFHSGFTCLVGSIASYKIYLFLPRLVGEDELPEFEIPEHDSLLVRLMHGGHDLSEEMPGVRLPEPPPRAHVAVHVAVARREHQVDMLGPHNNLLQIGERVNI